MLELVLWWLATSIVGLVAVPIALRVFRNLPDRGYAFARPLGLLLVGYLFWLAGTAGLLQNTRVAILFVMLLVGIVSVYLIRRKLVDLGQVWRECRRSIVVTEVLFAIALAAFALYRSYNPDISGTEKPMELAFINAILRSETFPPLDPWLSGFAISYYYFGYLMMAMLTKLTGIPSEITFNLALSLLFALTLTGAYGLVYNMVSLAEGRRERRPKRRLALLYGLLGSLFVGIVGNLEVIFEVLHANGVGTESFWQKLDIKNLATAPTSATWYPTDMWWWWRASRVVHDRNPLGQSVEVIDEFPAFSFVLGDCHPHVLALPFAFLTLGVALNVLAGRRDNGDAEHGETTGASGVVSWLRRATHESPADVLSWALILGSLGFLNTWDLPIQLAVFMVAYGIRRYWRGGRLSWLWLKDIITMGLVMLALGVLLYLPFYIGFRSQAGGIGLVIFNKTRLHQYLIMFGLFTYVLLGLWAALLSRRLATPLTRSTWAIVGISILVTAAFGILGWWLLVLLTLMLGVGLVVIQWLTQLGIAHDASLVSPDGALAPEDGAQLGTTIPLIFAIIMVLMGLALTFSVEFVYLKDIFDSRMNTVFKFYYQAWVLYGSAAAFAVYWLLHGSEGVRRPAGATSRGIWAVGLLALVAVSLLYPGLASFSKAGGFAGEPTLDGTTYLARYQSADYHAIQWLRANVMGPSTILEAPGPQYSEYARVSTHTGIPTVLGWGGHELQWRGNYDEPGKREPDIDSIYRSTTWQQARAIVEKYDIEYVYIGQLERDKYQLTPAATSKFEKFMKLVYDHGGVVIYQRW